MLLPGIIWRISLQHFGTIVFSRNLGQSLGKSWQSLSAWMCRLCRLWFLCPGCSGCSSFFWFFCHQVDSLQKLVGATCDSMTRLGRHHFCLSGRFGRMILRCTGNLYRCIGGNSILNFLLRSLLSKQAEGLKEIEKDAWQQNVLRLKLRSSWPIALCQRSKNTTWSSVASVV